VSVVLVVEDEEQVRVLAESFLQGEGHKTLSAATTEQALVLLEGDEPIDLMFIDLVMQSDPEAGLKVATKAAEIRPNLKVLYTSGQSSPIQSINLRRRSWPNSTLAVVQRINDLSDAATKFLFRGTDLRSCR
jgi:DNA-binding NtrC family response regulator